MTVSTVCPNIPVHILTTSFHIIQSPGMHLDTSSRNNDGIGESSKRPLIVCRTSLVKRDLGSYKYTLN